MSDKVVTTITTQYSTYSPTKNDLSKEDTRMIETITHQKHYYYLHCCYWANYLIYCEKTFNCSPQDEEMTESLTIPQIQKFVVIMAAIKTLLIYEILFHLQLWIFSQ